MGGERKWLLHMEYTYWVHLGEGDILDQQRNSTDTGWNDGLPRHNNVAHYTLPFISVRLCAGGVK
jgi:hypothetical protein